MKKVLIATPCYDGKVSVWYADSIIKMSILGLEKGISFYPVFLSFDALLERARNDLVSIAVEGNFDDILWIDADTYWDPEKAISLVESKEDVIGFPVIKKSLLKEEYNIYIENNVLERISSGDIIDVDSIGTGFLKMSKSAYMYLWDSSEEYLSNDKKARKVFEIQVKNGLLFSEDTVVCQKLKAGGFKILVDTSFTCDHSGTQIYTGDFSLYIKRIIEKEKNKG